MGVDLDLGSTITNLLVAKGLGILPDHDIKIFIGVEGINDINFLRCISRILIQHGEDVLDLERLEQESQLLFFPLGGNCLSLWSSRLKGLNRPEFYVFDRDVPPPQAPKCQKTIDEINQRPGCTACHTDKKEMENYIHPAAIKAIRPEVDIVFDEFDDVPELVAKAVHDVSESPNAWHELGDRKMGEKIRKAKGWLNFSAVDAMTPTLLDEIDPKGDVRGWLNTIKVYMQMV